MDDSVQWLSQSDYSIWISVLSRILLKFHSNTELARAVDVMMAQAKRIYILMIKVDFNFASRYFLKEIKKNGLRVSLRVKKMLWEQHFSFPKRSLVFL